jgi:DNA invertase Pin-like site-specific DNA recombinase
VAPPRPEARPIQSDYTLAAGIIDARGGGKRGGGAPLLQTDTRGRKKTEAEASVFRLRDAAVA